MSSLGNSQNSRRATTKRKSRTTKDDSPRMSLRSVLFCMRIYREAIGARRFLTYIYRLYTAISPTISALLAGRAVTYLTAAISSHDLMPFFVTVIEIIVIAAVGIVLQEANSILTLGFSQEIYIKASEAIVKQYINIPLSERESRAFADKFERVRNFGSSVGYVATSTLSILTSVVALISTLVGTFVVSPIITLIVVVSAIPYSLLSLRLAAKNRHNWRTHTRDRRVAWNIQSIITNSDYALEVELNELSDELIRRMVKAGRSSQAQDLADARKFFVPNIGARFLSDLMSYIALIFVALKIVAGELAIGQFLTIRTLLVTLSDQIFALVMSGTSISEQLVNATDYMEFMEVAPRTNGSVKVTHIPKIEFRNVTFRYPGADHDALHDVSFVINPGDSLAIVGENGAGKTTIIKLLIGAYTPTAGLILVDDTPLERIERVSYLAQIGALFQNFACFEFATLGENVWFGDVAQKYDVAKIRQSLQLAGLGELPEHYRKGLNQVLSKNLDDENPASLSGGQWQRIGIARAFFRSPGVLLLDEPTSAIDAKSEYEIFKNIIANQAHKSTIIISHRFSTVRKASKIIVLKDGRIAESGTHDQLIANNSLYKEMFELQAEGYN